jgi:hypothetical protein
MRTITDDDACVANIAYAFCQSNAECTSEDGPFGVPVEGSCIFLAPGCDDGVPPGGGLCFVNCDSVPDDLFSG